MLEKEIQIPEIQNSNAANNVANNVANPNVNTNVNPINQNDSSEPKKETIEQLAALLKSNPKIQEELLMRLRGDTTSNQLNNQPSNMQNNQPNQPIQQEFYTEKPTDFDVINAPINEFINYKNDSSNYEVELKSHLLLRHPELDGKKVDLIVEEAKKRMMDEYELTKQLPMNPAKTVRTNAVLLLKEIAKHQTEMENLKIQSAAIQYNIAEKEFGANYVHEKKAAAEEFIANQLEIPIDELRTFTPERYSRLLKTYSQRNMSVQEINLESKQVNDFNKILKERSKMLNM